NNVLICVIGAESGGVSLCVYNNARECKVRTFYAHSSTVTDVLIQGNTVFTLGVDQRIFEWKIIIDENTIGLETKRCYFTNVADCSSFLYTEDESKNRSIIVTGVGLQKLEL
uniref:Uncharacterized protein n=1 Tax=Romanomermis culicivorax TaxID=13658 RepID=A0A915L4S9_ROMCU